MGAGRDFSWGLFVIVELLYLLGVSTKPSSLKWLVYWLPLTLISTYLVGFTTLHNAVSDYGIGSYIFALVINASDALVISDAQRDFSRDGEVGRVEDQPFAARLKWGAHLLGSPRGVGWNVVHASHLPPSPPTHMTKYTFIVSRVGEIVFNIVLCDLNGFVLRASPCYGSNGLPVSHPQVAWFWRFSMFGYAVQSYANINILHCFYSIVSVGLGLSEPSEWPPMFGQLKDAYTVRRFWGRVWHQMFRRSLSSHSSRLAQALGISKKGTSTEFFMLFVSFFLSALCHHAGDVMLLKNLSGGSFVFFFAQPFAMTLEEIALATFERAGIVNRRSRIAKVVGFVWVLLWFAYMLPVLIQPQLAAGFFEDGSSFSLISGFLYGDWVPNPHSEL